MEIKVGESVDSQILDYSNVTFRCNHCHQYGHVVQDCARPFRRYVWKKKEGSGACAETSNVYKPNDQQVEPVVLILDRASGDSGGDCTKTQVDADKL